MVAKYAVYLAVGPDFEPKSFFGPRQSCTVGWTSDPALEAELLARHGASEILPLGYPLPAYLAHWISSRLSQERSPLGTWKHCERSGSSLRRRLKTRALRSAAALLSREGFPPFLPELQPVRPESLDLPRPSPEECLQVLGLLKGRILLTREIGRGLCRTARRMGPWTLERVLQMICMDGGCLRAPGIEITGFGGMKCNRCGETREIERVDCAACGNARCPWCRECSSMGTVRGCDTLFAVAGGSLDGDAEGADAGWSLGIGSEAGPAPHAATEAHPREGQDLCGDPGEAACVHRLGILLTPAQARAAGAVLDFVEGGGKSECLVWAACGAGKTEVTFPAIAASLRRGHKVLLVAPRRDAIRGVEPRLRKAFGDHHVTLVLGGTGGSSWSCRTSIVAATAHQAIRFFREFDVVILDEVDAFPYHGSRMLQLAVARSRAQGGKLVLLTATPTEDLLGRAKRGDLALVTIPVRHHGWPLPEPCIAVDPTLGRFRGWNEVSGPGGGFEASPVLRDRLGASLERGAQILVFVPAVRLAELVADGLRRALGVRVEASWASDSGREAKLARFASGRSRVLVATTILERGVTVANLDVVVLFADWEATFDDRSLVQMAGRCGRVSSHPTGDVWFVGSKASRSMELAVKRIRETNRIAGAQGYLADFSE
ncbi:MAG: DEAD/DEAH box helicase [Firmicutes bacterium]|nr:DEAD/DEAH box helicase [Bacillota bacterium]